MALQAIPLSPDTMFVQIERGLSRDEKFASFCVEACLSKGDALLAFVNVLQVTLDNKTGDISAISDAQLALWMDLPAPVRAEWGAAFRAAFASDGVVCGWEKRYGRFAKAGKAGAEKRYGSKAASTASSSGDAAPAPAKKGKPVEAERGPSPEEDEAVKRFRAFYPARAGAKDLAGGEARLRALMVSGDVLPSQVESVVREYAKVLGDKVGTEYVQQASVFWGPTKQTWREFLPTDNGEQALRDEARMSEFDI